MGAGGDHGGTWIWATAYHALQVFPTLEESVHFSLVAYTTLGLGDIVPAQKWRLLAGMEAANGFLNFGLVTALLIEALRQIRINQVAQKRQKTGLGALLPNTKGRIVSQRKR